MSQRSVVRVLAVVVLAVLHTSGLAADGFIIFNSGSGIVKTDLDGLEEEILTSDSQDTFARISADGSQIVFWRGTSLYTIASDGSDLWMLLSNVAVGQGRHLCWNADGSKIAFAEGPPGNTRLHTVNADGSAHRVISTADDFGQFPWCDWSADDRQIYISFGQSANAAALEITVCATDGSGCRQITNSPGSMLSELPVLSSERDLLFFVTRQSPFSHTRSLIRASLDGSNPQALTDGNSTVIPVASFDGRHYFLDDRLSDGFQLFSMAEDGTDRRQQSVRPGGLPASSHVFVGNSGPNVFFDGFTGNITKHWIISQGRESGPGFGRCTNQRGPQDNLFCGDLTTSQPDLGKVRLEGVVASGIRYGSEITSVNTFPAEGTFAANVRLEGPAENRRSHASVKAFFTFSSIGPDQQWQMEHDFEVITGASKLYEQQGWATRQELAASQSPRLMTVTHADGGVSLQPSGLVSLAALGPEDVTFVVSVRCTLNCGTDAPRIYEAHYQLLTSWGHVVDLGTTETEHHPLATDLRVLFNVWWLEPAGICIEPGDQKGPPTVGTLPGEATTQFLEVRWFLHSRLQLDPLAAYELGNQLDDAD